MAIRRMFTGSSNRVQTGILRQTTVQVGNEKAIMLEKLRPVVGEVIQITFPATAKSEGGLQPLFVDGNIKTTGDPCTTFYVKPPKGQVQRLVASGPEMQNAKKYLKAGTAVEILAKPIGKGYLGIWGSDVRELYLPQTDGTKVNAQTGEILGAATIPVPANQPVRVVPFAA